jgi:phage shock protein PspC (stress-responsive transcriptional regulator)
MNTTTTNPSSEHTDSHTDSTPGHGYGPQPAFGGQSLYRSRDDRMLAGVAGGLGRYLGVDPTVVRIILVVLLVVGGAGLPLYLAGWLLIPEEGCDQSLASQFIESLQSRSR